MRKADKVITKKVSDEALERVYNGVESTFDKRFLEMVKKVSFTGTLSARWRDGELTSARLSRTQSFEKIMENPEFPWDWDFLEEDEFDDED